MPVFGITRHNGEVACMYNVVRTPIHMFLHAKDLKAYIASKRPQLRFILVQGHQSNTNCHLQSVYQIIVGPVWIKGFLKEQIPKERNQFIVFGMKGY